MPIDAPLSVSMKRTQPHNWSYVFYYAMICIASLGLIVLVAEIFFPSPPPKLMPRRDALSARSMNTSSEGTRLQETPGGAPLNPTKEKIRLVLNHEKAIGKSKIIYRGLDGDSKFKIDVVIPELDPNAFYGYRLSIDKARQGFRLAGQNFKLISARKSAIRIWHLKK
jgi:hypothetical protein